MVVEEGRARLYVPPSVFYSKHQELQRDLSVSVLRALRRVEYRQGDVAEVGRDAFKVKLDAVGGDIPDFPLSRLATESPAPNAGKVLRVCDALAGTGVRAIRYALEAGPVQVVANDKSAEACGAIVQSAFLSGIERIDHFTANGSQTMDEGSAGAPGTASPQGPTVKIVNSRRSESDAVTSCSRFRLGSVASCGDKVGGETSLPSASEVSLRIDSKTAAETALDAPPPPAARVPGSDPVQPSFAVRLGDANDLLLSPTELDKPKSAPQTAGRGWDLVDVDPFGSCAGFLEAATSAVADGGVLAVASTDLAVLCGKKGTKACLERYGARVADRAYSKEAALRVLLHRMDVIARRQERRIIPLLCAALEFYVRLFVMVVPLGEDLSEKDATSSPPPLVVIQSLHSPEFSLRYLSSERSIDEASAHPASPEPGKSGQRTCVMDAVVLGDHLNPESGSKGFRAGRRGRTLHAATELGTGKCESQGRDEVSANSKPSVTLGPFWSGPLFHRGFVAVVIREVRLSAETNGDDRGSMASTAMSEIGRTRASLVQGGESRSERHGDHGDRDDRGDHGGDGAFASSVALLRTRRQLLFLLETLTSEVDDSPLFFSIPELVAVPVTRRSSLAKRGGRRRRDGDARSSNPTVEAVLAELRAEGFVCSSSHVDPRGIKTAAPLAAVQRALSSARSAQGVNVDGSSARAAIGSLQAARNQLPQSVGINCRPGTDVTGSVAPGGSGDWPSGQPSETYLGSCLRSESCISCLPREARTREPSAVHAVPDVEVSSEGSRVSDPKNLRNVSTRKLVEGKDGSPCAGSILASPCDRDDTDHPSSTSQVCGTPVGCSRGGRIRKRGALEAHPGERPGEAPRPVGPCLTGVKLSGVEAAATVATGAGPRVPLGRFSYPPDLSHFESSPSALLSDGATSGGETRTIQKGGGDKSEHVSLATLEQFVESALTEKAASCADAHAATPVSSADDAMARPEFSADEVICFLIVRPAGTERVAVSRGCSFPREEGCTRGRGAKGDVEASVSQRFPQHVRFMASVEEACRVSNEAASDGCKSRVTILLLGGEGEEIYDAGRRGVVLAGAGASLIGVAGVNGHLPVLEGRADAPVIRCTGDRVSIRSLKIRGGVATGGENEGNSRGFPLGRSCAPHEDDSSSGIHSRRPPFNGGDDHEFRGQDDFGSHTSDCNSSARLERKGGIGREEGSGMNSADALPEVVRWRDGAKDFLVKQASATCGAGRRTVAAVAKDEPSAGTALAALKHGAATSAGEDPDACVESRESKREEVMRRKRPRLVFDREAAKAVMAARSLLSRPRERVGGQGAVRAEQSTRGGIRRRRRELPERRERTRGVTVHAVSVESGSARMVGCDITSVLPSACVCVSGAGTSASLERVRLADGKGAGLLVCGKATASAVCCSFERMGAAGVEARGGSTVVLSRCLLSCCDKSGVFVQGFSKGKVSACDIVSNGFAGVEALRNASVEMDACLVLRSRRGGVLVHASSDAAMRDCSVVSSSLAGVDVRTGAGATIEACAIRDGRASGIHVSRGGSIGVRCTVLAGNQLAAVELQGARAVGVEAGKEEASGRRGLGTGVCAEDRDRDGAGAAHVPDPAGGARCVWGWGNRACGNGLDGVMDAGEVTGSCAPEIWSEGPDSGLGFR